LVSGFSCVVLIFLEEDFLRSLLILLILLSLTLLSCLVLLIMIEAGIGVHARGGESQTGRGVVIDCRESMVNADFPSVDLNCVNLSLFIQER